MALTSADAAARFVVGRARWTLMILKRRICGPTEQKGRHIMAWVGGEGSKGQPGVSETARKATATKEDAQSNERRC